MNVKVCMVRKTVVGKEIKANKEGDHDTPPPKKKKSSVFKEGGCKELTCLNYPWFMQV